MLPTGTHFIFCEFVNSVVVHWHYNNYYNVDIADEKQHKFLTSHSRSILHDSLEKVGQDYYTLYRVTKECRLSEFATGIPDLMVKSRLGYGFYEFTKPELISYDKQVILMDKVDIINH